MPDHPKTYVLIGHDQLGADKIYSARDDVVIIRPEKGKTITQLLAQIRTPANVILQCHGAKGLTFRWNPKGDRTSYAEFFEALPRSGTLSVTLGSCYGGDAQAQHMLKHAPAGCLVQSMVGENMLNLSDTVFRFAEEAKGLTKPIDLFLESLDNFSAVRFQEFIDEYNKKFPKNPYDSNPDKALPHILGIGGDPGVQINLNDEMALLTENVDRAALARAVNRVQARFDTKKGRTKIDEKGKKYPLLTVAQSLNGAAEIRQDLDIVFMADNLRQGYIPENVDDKRVAFAIIAAYLDESGELKRRIEATPNYMPLKKLDAYGNAISYANTSVCLEMQTDATRVAHAFDVKIFKKQPDLAVRQTIPPSITFMEQKYLESVQMRMMTCPDMKEVVGDLRKNFERTVNDDPLAESLKLQLQANGISTKSWER